MLNPVVFTAPGHLATVSEVEITSTPPLTPKQACLVDLHSVINLLNVLHGSIHLLAFELPNAPQLTIEAARIIDLSDRLHHAAHQQITFDLEPDLPALIRAAVTAACAQPPSGTLSTAAIEHRDNILSILGVFRIRLLELHARLDAPSRWAWFTVDHLEDAFRQVLAAIELNAHGDYHIVAPGQRTAASDYEIGLQIDSPQHRDFLMPPVFHDVMRDLIANARKYTTPGGKIDATLRISDRGLDFMVSDTGMGIPRDELEKVFEFGYRASNALARRTMGAGCGLTKALAVTRQFNGSLWVRSALGCGTAIRIHLPVPASTGR
jgi:hypothetical protein